ncbi:unnamed protein product, partial [Rotaria socialis]
MADGNDEYDDGIDGILLATNDFTGSTSVKFKHDCSIFDD